MLISARHAVMLNCARHAVMLISARHAIMLISARYAKECPPYHGTNASNDHLCTAYEGQSTTLLGTAQTTTSDSRRTGVMVAPD